MRSQFPHVPPNWPKETQFLKLTNGASGLFVFARTAVRFMEDPNHADPVSRLNLLLSVIDYLGVAVSDEHPFALLDALYHHILISIPSTLWPTAKRILGFYICSQPRRDSTLDGLLYALESHSLMAASVILNIEQHVVYSSLHKLHSVLEIPRPDVPHESGVSFFHASFGDYLRDPIRSNGFSIDRRESVDDITRGFVRIYMEAPWDNEWAQYTPHLSGTAGQNFYEQLQKDAVTTMYHVTTGDLGSDRGRGPFKHEKDRSECLDVLSQIDVAWLYRSAHGYHFVQWLLNLWRAFPDELNRRGLLEVVPLRELRVDHLEHEKYIGAVSEHPRARQENLAYGVFTSVPFQDFKVEFQLLQQQHPNQGALIHGSSSQRRNAFFHHDRVPDNIGYREGFFCIPYPH